MPRERQREEIDRRTARLFMLEALFGNALRRSEATTGVPRRSNRRCSVRISVARARPHSFAHPIARPTVLPGRTKTRTLARARAVEKGFFSKNALSAWRR